ncbi:hypothetical protein BI347_22015 [Chromobacterium sphagni]|uniref:DUF2282 domain-containing protein n=1 Tax=Chromobacterium sphagni TaxID=1903179 RepID=A0A1S1WTE2_9NEIS|nr:hypothetical protein [Chromobacterium sphagni]OHX10456.1 hypothetical protein BI347_22015 [Chromobacterium sphagni]
MKKSIFLSLLVFSGFCHAQGGGGYGGIPSLAEPFMHVDACLDKNARIIDGTAGKKKAGQCEIVGIVVIDSKNAEFVKR